MEGKAHGGRTSDIVRHMPRGKLVIAANEAKTEALEELQDLLSCRSINLPWKSHFSNQSALKLLWDITVLEVEEGPPRCTCFLRAWLGVLFELIECV